MKETVAVVPEVNELKSHVRRGKTDLVEMTGPTREEEAFSPVKHSTRRKPVKRPPTPEVDTDSDEEADADADTEEVDDAYGHVETDTDEADDAGEDEAGEAGDDLGVPDVETAIETGAATEVDVTKPAQDDFNPWRLATLTLLFFGTMTLAGLSLDHSFLHNMACGVCSGSLV